MGSPVWKQGGEQSQATDRLVRLINSPELMKNRTLVLICVTHAVQECTAAFRGLCSPRGDEADGTRAPSAAGGTGGCGQHREHKDTRRKASTPPPGRGRAEWEATFSMTRFPPKRVTNSAGEATVKSRCRSIFLCSRPRFARCSPDMLGLQRDGRDISEGLRASQECWKGSCPPRLPGRSQSCGQPEA